MPHLNKTDIPERVETYDWLFGAFFGGCPNHGTNIPFSVSLILISFKIGGNDYQ